MATPTDGMENAYAAVLEPCVKELSTSYNTKHEQMTSVSGGDMCSRLPPSAEFVDVHNNHKHHHHHQQWQDDDDDDGDTDAAPVELRKKPNLHRIGRSVSTFSLLCRESGGDNMRHSFLEAKEFAYSKLKDELRKAQLELKIKDQQNEKLIKMENELEELTASLFEEANKMVQDANLKRMHSEKLLVEANSKIEVLEAEVVALKTLVITSTPSMPNRHLHPQLQPDIPKFVKGHRRSTSHNDLPKQSIPSSLSLPLNPCESIDKKEKDVDPIMFKEFQQWRAKTELKSQSPFLQRVYQEEISPCMNFHNEQLAGEVFDSIRNNLLTIELITGKRSFPNCCALLDCQRLCQYRVRLTDNGRCYFVSELARNRIAAVCDFYTYIRYIHQGLVKTDDKTAYCEIIRLRKCMALSRLGLTSEI